MYYLVTLIFISSFSIIILLNSQNIGNSFRLIDYPNKRKLLKQKAVKIGSILFTLPIFVTLIDSYLNKHFLNIQIISLFFCLFAFLLIGYVDDSKGLSAIKKILLYFIISFIFFKINEQLVIHNLNFYLFDTKNISNISLYFTCFCIIALIVATDLFDGINLSVSIFLLSKLIIIYFYFDQSYFSKTSLLYFIIPLFLFIRFNLKNKVFLGTGATCVLSFVISLELINYYNLVPTKLSAIHILSLLFLPGLDMIRVFLYRFVKSGQIFKPDKKHFHHLLAKKFGLNRVIFFLPVLFVFFDFITIFFYEKIYYIIFFQFLTYILLIKICLFKKQ